MLYGNLKTGLMEGTSHFTVLLGVWLDSLFFLPVWALSFLKSPAFHGFFNYTVARKKLLMAFFCAWMHFWLFLW